jgi:hypothetical protein
LLIALSEHGPPGAVSQPHNRIPPHSLGLLPGEHLEPLSLSVCTMLVRLVSLFALVAVANAQSTPAGTVQLDFEDADGTCSFIKTGDNTNTNCDITKVIKMLERPTAK